MHFTCMPAPQIFRDGDVEAPGNYEGPRETAGIVSFLTKQTGPPSLLLTDAAAVKAFRAFSDEKDIVSEHSRCPPICFVVASLPLILNFRSHTFPALRAFGDEKDTVGERLLQ